ncbi:MAG: D-alanine--D-alanine ligase [Spirochaetales bacterium]|nr:D-alanine--D-alanine ligase [Spirochaetales bacterium]
MVIGITYDLREEYLAEGYSEEETAEFDSSATVDSIADTLAVLGHNVVRIGNVRELMRRLTMGERWDLVFNIAEGLSGYAREAQVPVILEMYDIPYTFSDPLLLSVCLHKGMAKHVIRDFGIPTPEFAVVGDESDIDDITLPFPLFAKPVAEGTGKGVTSSSMINSKEELAVQCVGLLQKFRQPVIVEGFLPGREFTVGILGTGKNARVIGVLEVILNNMAERHVYSYVNKEQCETLVTYRLSSDLSAETAAATALKTWRALGCRDAGRIDLRQDRDGIPCVMEINPLAGLNPTHSDLPMICSFAGMTYKELIDGIVESASCMRRESDNIAVPQRVSRCFSEQ